MAAATLAHRRAPSPAALGFAAVVAAVAVLVERPVIEAAGRWRPWTRRVASFPADRHIRPAPSVA